MNACWLEHRNNQETLTIDGTADVFREESAVDGMGLNERVWEEEVLGEVVDYLDVVKLGAGCDGDSDPNSGCGRDEPLETHVC